MPIRFRSLALAGLAAILVAAGWGEAAEPTAYLSPNPTVYHAKGCRRLHFPRALPLAEATALYPPCPVCHPERAGRGAESTAAPAVSAEPVLREAAAADGRKPTATADVDLEGAIANGVERAVAADEASRRLRPPSPRRRPFVRNSLAGAAAGAMIGGFVGYQIDVNEGHVGNYTTAYLLIGAGAGAAIGALGALLF